MHLTKQSVKQLSKFFLALFSIVQLSCNDASAVKQEDQPKQDSLVAGLTPQALSGKLHELSFPDVQLSHPHPEFVTVIREVYPDGPNWVVTFIDSSAKNRVVFLRGIALIDAKGTITDAYFSDKVAARVHGGFLEFFNVKFTKPELEVDHIIYYANNEGQLFVYDSLMTKFKKNYPDSMFSLRPADVPEKYVDTFRLKKHFTVTAGKLVAKE